MQMYTNKTNEKKNKHFFFPWYCDYAERQPFDEIKHRHTLKEVGDVAEVGMIGRLREGEAESACNGYCFFIVNSNF